MKGLLVKTLLYISKKAGVDPSNPLTQDTAQLIFDIVKEVIKP